MNTKRITYLAMLIAAASIIHYIESLLPPILPAVPGAKLGLANIFTLAALGMGGFADAMMVSIVRCLIGSLISGSVTALVYSMTGAILSTVVMTVVFKLAAGKISMIGISILGALFHNAGQLMAASLMLGSAFIWSYYPYMALISVPTGILTGYCAKLTVDAIEKAGAR